MASNSNYCTLGTLKAELEENGVAVLPGVLTEDQCDNYVTQYQQWLAQFGTGFPDNINSIIHKYGISQHEATWDVRLKAKHVFETLWGTQKLLSSTDGVAIGRPPEKGETKFEEAGKNTLHHDQDGHKLGLHSYQGAVYLEEAAEDDWCFMVIEKSHKLHTPFFDKHKSGRSEFRRTKVKETKWFLERGCTLKRISVPKGGIVLWDSRTVHAGAPPKAERANPDRWRYIVFVCMAPAIWAEQEDIAEKKRAYHKLLVTKHWPAAGAGAFNKGKSAFDITEHGPLGKSDAARLLAGDLDYDFDDGQSNGIPYKPKYKM